MKVIRITKANYRKSKTYSGFALGTKFLVSDSVGIQYVRRKLSNMGFGADWSVDFQCWMVSQ